MEAETQVAGVTGSEPGFPADSSSGQAPVSAQEASQAQANAPGAGQQSAFTLSAAFGLFNIVVGIMLVIAFLSFFAGLTGYLTRLGLENRIDGLRAMHWGVTILFVLVILLAIVNFLQFHTTFLLAVVGIIVVVFAAWAIVKSVQEAKPAEKKEEK